MRRGYLLLPILVSVAPFARAQTIVPALQGDLEMTDVVDNLSNPTAAEFLPDGRLLIIQQNGQFLVWNGSGAAMEVGTLAVHYDGFERGLLGLAIDPQFATTNRVYFYYSASGAGSADKNRVAYTTIDPTSSMVDVANKIDILTGIYGPANHDGGGITFGPDGNLYVGAGDTGCNCGCPPGQADNYFGTCLTNLNGKIMRIDREGGIPATNPLVGVAAVAACGPNVGSCNTMPNQGNTAAPRTEIFLWGFRNPWRFSFDRLTGYMWIGDVGEITWEEITVAKVGGEHHGWPWREGQNGDPGSTCQQSTPQAVGAACVEPVIQYNHNNSSASVTGGVFSHHCTWPEAYRDKYWFGDYNLNDIWMANPNAARDGIDGQRVNVSTNSTSPVHFFEGLNGGIYFVSVDGGFIKRIGPVTPAQCQMPMDAGFADAEPVIDTGVENPDAETPGTDAMTPGADASGGAGDVSGGPADAAAVRDGGRDVVGEGRSDGCGCTATQAAPSSLMIIGTVFAVVALARRGRRLSARRDGRSSSSATDRR